jgi:polyhydroxybutyrate depolymerase
MKKHTGSRRTLSTQRRGHRGRVSAAATSCMVAIVSVLSSNSGAAASDTTRLPVTKGLTLQVGSTMRTYDLASPPVIVAATVPPTSARSTTTKGKGKKRTGKTPKKAASGKPASEKPTPDKKVLRPLILVFHGNGGSADQVLDQTDEYGSPLGQWLSIGARENLVVAAPNGTLGSDGKQSWNDCRGDAASNAKTDDVAFVLALIDELVRTQNVDPSRVYAVGMSNGGHLVFRLALEVGDRFAGFGPVSAALPAQSSCKDTGVGKPIVMINGNADPFWPFAGGSANGRAGAVGTTRGTILSNADTIAAMVRRNSASTNAITTQYQDVDQNDGTTARLREFASQTAPVFAITIDGGGHAEPSKTRIYSSNYERLIGRQNHDIETAEEQWRLFNTLDRR